LGLKFIRLKSNIIAYFRDFYSDSDFLAKKLAEKFRRGRGGESLFPKEFVQMDSWKFQTLFDHLKNSGFPFFFQDFIFKLTK